MTERDNFVFFWGKQDIASNWHPAKFEVRGRKFGQAEQYMMYAKACLFNDQEMADKILQETDPAKNKKQGRQVRGFDQAIWDQKADELVKIGLREKFLQNPRMLQWLVSTEGKQLAEASPYDKIWGIGLKANHPDAVTPEKWPGQNRLGKTLEQLRDDLLLKPEALPPRAAKAVENAKAAVAGARGRQYSVGSGPAF